jgi:hypothetical protein
VVCGVIGPGSWHGAGILRWVDAHHWWSLDDRAAAEVANAIAEQVGGTLSDIRPGPAGRVALFDVGGQQFAFVPGGLTPAGTATVG